MADVVFASQRGEGGEYFFVEQQALPFTEISASAVSVSSVQSSLNFLAAEFVAIASSESNVVATLGKYLGVAAVATSLSTTSAALVIVSAGIRDISAQAISMSSCVADLYAGFSTIPKSAKVRAVPVDAESLRIRRYRGDTYADAFFVFDDKTGLPLDIIGCRFKLTLATVKNPNSADDLVYTLNGDVEDSTSGVVYFSPSYSQADRTGHFYYDMEMTDSGGVVKTLTASKYIYLQDITP